MSVDLGSGDSEKPKAGNAAAVAAALWDSGDFANTALFFERAVQETPSDIEALHGMGRLKLAYNDLAAAILFLEQAQSLVLSFAGGARDELSLRIKRDLAWAYYRLDRFDLAADLFEQLPGQQPLAQQLRAFGGSTPYQMGVEVEEIALPFLGTDPLPVVTLVIGGKEHAFIIDTGAAQLTLDSAFLRELNLPTHGTTSARLASGTNAPLVYTIVPEVTLGEATLYNVPAEVMDIRRFAPQISGFIGTNVLQRFHVMMDIEGEVLRLRPLRHQIPFATRGKIELPLFWLDAHLLFTPLRLNQHHTMAYLTTGLAGVDFAIPESTARQARLQRKGLLEGVSGGGSQDLELVIAERVAVGAWERTHVEGLLGFFPPELEWRYGFRVGAIVSYALLRHKQFGINFETMHLLIE
jgi:predicted aspartyl protease